MTAETAAIRPVAGVVLAAGGSTRMGRPKQLLAIDGEPLVRRVTRQVVGACAPVHVVVGAARDAVAAALADLPVTLVDNPAWADGLGGSVARGVAAAFADPAVDAVLLTVGDLPRLLAAHLRAMVAGFRRSGAAALASCHERSVGVPAIFHRRVGGALLALRGPIGARAVLAGLGAEVVPFELPEAALDVDGPADWARAGLAPP